MKQNVQHRRKISSVLPKLKLQQRAEGFVLSDESITWLGLLLTGFAAVSCSLFTLFIVGGTLSDRHVASAFCAGVVLIPLAVVFLYVFIRQLRIRSRLAPAELVVSHWPLRMGDQARVIYRQRLRRRSDVERIEARLFCREVTSRRKGKSLEEVERKLYQRKLAPVNPLPGAFVLEAAWQIDIPAEGPPTLAAGYNKLQWQLEIKLRIRDGVSDPIHFEILVLPEVLPA